MAIPLSADLVAATREALVWLVRARVGGAPAGVPPGPAVTQAAVEVVSAAAGSPCSEQAVWDDVAGLDVNGLGNRLVALAPNLDEPGRERFLLGCARVALAEGSLSDAQRQALEWIAASLDIPAAHAWDLIEQVPR
jgi:hypothetical protein